MCNESASDWEFLNCTGEERVIFQNLKIKIPVTKPGNLKNYAFLLFLYYYAKTNMELYFSVAICCRKYAHFSECYCN